MIILRFKSSIFLIHHRHSFIFVHVVVSHWTALKLSIMMGKRFILFK